MGLDKHTEKENPLHVQQLLDYQDHSTIQSVDITDRTTLWVCELQIKLYYRRINPADISTS